MPKKTVKKRSHSQQGRRNKQRGDEFEREVAELFRDRLHVEARRILDQAREGGHDIDLPSLFSLVTEAKRTKTGQLRMSWLLQAQEAMTAEDQIPLVVTRGDGADPVAFMWFEDLLTILKWMLMLRDLLDIGSDDPQT